MLGSRDKAVAKFPNFVAEKKSKGYSESQSQMDGDRNISDIRRAIQLLNIIRPCIPLKDV
ncbi:hypothetical protein [Nostoc sp.]|uniref:hypothetical protein n=1 Tax=Nostoc sp. TaxID=1180 RepID=UPI003FA58A9F